MSTPTPALPHRGQYDPARVASQLYLLWQVRPHSRAAACLHGHWQAAGNRDLEERKEYKLTE